MRGIAVAIGLALTLFAAAASAQDTFPSREVTMIVPAAPGGAFDVFARMLGKKLGEKWGHQLVVDNRGGGAGNVGASAVVKAKPDGYTLFIWNDTLLINPSLLPNVPYDPKKDFTPISLALFVPNILVAHPSTRFKSFLDLVTAAKASPRKFSLGSPGNGSPAHLGAVLMQQLAGIELVHVPYRGAGPAVNDVVAGHIPLAVVAVPGAMEHVRSGTLVPLAITSDNRIEALPNVPTLKEAGLRDYRVDTFLAILGPAGMPQPIVAQLEGEIADAVRDPSFRASLIAQGFEPVGGSAAELKAVIDRDLPLWSELVRSSGAKAD